MSKESGLEQTRELLNVVHRLRKECPWDKKQTHKSLIPYLLEEAYETIDAIEGKQASQLREELGDLLLQIVLHAEIANERKGFSFEDVAKQIKEKMIARHPHIFSDAKIRSVKDQIQNWSRLKEKEKPNRSLLAGTPKALPALQLAQRYGEIAASVNFDWENMKQVLVKLDEEVGELKAELKRKPAKKAAVEMELGDVLFVLTRVASHAGVDAERALRKSAAKFQERFGRLEKAVKKTGKPMSASSPAELDALWQSIK